MKKIILLFILFYCLPFGVKAQDVSFINHNQSLIQLNPSFAGSNGNWRVQSNYGNINPNLYFNHKISYLSLDAFIKPLKGAFALTYLTDNQMRGLLKDQRIGLIYSQYFKFSNNQLVIIPSLEINYVQRNLDLNRLTFSEPPYLIIHYSNNFNTTKINLDFSTGLLINYKNYFGGFSIKHLTQPDIGFRGPYKLPAAINIHASYTRSLSTKSFVQFFTLFNHQGSQNVFSLNSNAILVKHLVVGLGLSSNYETSLSLGYRNNYFSSILSFGKDFSKMARNSLYSANLSLAIRLSKNEQKKWVESFEKW